MIVVGGMLDEVGVRQRDRDACRFRDVGGSVSTDGRGAGQERMVDEYMCMQ